MDSRAVIGIFLILLSSYLLWVVLLRLTALCFFSLLSMGVTFLGALPFCFKWYTKTSLGGYIRFSSVPRLFRFSDMSIRSSFEKLSTINTFCELVYIISFPKVFGGLTVFKGLKYFWVHFFLGLLLPIKWEIYCFWFLICNFDEDFTFKQVDIFLLTNWLRSANEMVFDFCNRSSFNVFRLFIKEFLDLLLEIGKFWIWS